MRVAREWLGRNLRWIICVYLFKTLIVLSLLAAFCSPSWRQ